MRDFFLARVGWGALQRPTTCVGGAVVGCKSTTHPTPEYPLFPARCLEPDWRQTTQPGRFRSSGLLAPWGSAGDLRMASSSSGVRRGGARALGGRTPDP